LPTQIPAGITVAQLIEVMHRDKKVHAGQIRWVLPRRIGHAEVVRNVPLEAVTSLLQQVVAR
jgi:3-dehydroquinate synthase